MKYLEIPNCPDIPDKEKEERKEMKRKKIISDSKFQLPNMMHRLMARLTRVLYSGHVDEWGMGINGYSLVTQGRGVCVRGPLGLNAPMAS